MYKYGLGEGENTLCFVVYVSRLGGELYSINDCFYELLARYIIGFL